MKLSQLILVLALCLTVLMLEGFYLSNEIDEMSHSLRRSAHQLETINRNLEITNQRLREATELTGDLVDELDDNNFSE